MAKAARTLERVLRGTADASVRFDDLRQLLLRLAFVERVRGDHPIFTRDGVEDYPEPTATWRDGKSVSG
jgi:hypothetical protein